MGAGATSRWAVKTTGAFDEDDDDKTKYSPLCVLTPKQVRLVLHPVLPPPDYANIWRELAKASRPSLSLPPGAAFCGEKGLLAANAKGALHLPAQREFMLWILLREVRTGVRVKNFAPDGDKCAACGLPETLEHLLWDCHKVHKVWVMVLNTFYRLCGLNSLITDNARTWTLALYLRVLLARTPAEPPHRPGGGSSSEKWQELIWRVLRMEALWSIWLYRCRARDYGNGILPTPYTDDDIVRCCQLAIRRRVLQERLETSAPQLNFKHWLTNGAIAVENTRLELVFHPDIGGCVRLFSEDEAASAHDDIFDSVLRQRMTSDD